jgi:hypothetical protein
MQTTYVPCRSPALTLNIVQYIENCIYLRVSSYCSLYVRFERMQRFCLQHVGRALRFYMLHSPTHAFAPFTPFASPFRHFVLHVFPSPSFRSPCVPNCSVIQQTDYANLQFLHHKGSMFLKLCVDSTQAWIWMDVDQSCGQKGLITEHVFYSYVRDHWAQLLRKIFSTTYVAFVWMVT